MPKEIV